MQMPEPSPIRNAQDLEAMRRRMAALDTEIAGLRQSLGSVTAGAPEPRSSIPAATCPPTYLYPPLTPSTPMPVDVGSEESPPFTERAAAAVEELSKNLRRAMARASSPGRPYGAIGGSTGRSDGCSGRGGEFERGDRGGGRCSYREGSGCGEPDGVRARRRRSCVCIVSDVTYSCTGVVMYLLPAAAARVPAARGRATFRGVRSP